MSATDEPRRLTPTERLHEVTMATLRKQPVAPEHTVDLTLNAKGDVQIAVAGRGTDLEATAALTAAVFDSLCERYPRNGGAK